MKTDPKKKNYDSKIKESISTEKKIISPNEKPDKTKPKQNDFSRFKDPTITSIQPKKKIRDINQDLIKENEERIDEELNLKSSQTDDTEDELDEEDESIDLEEGE